MSIQTLVYAFLGLSVVLIGASLNLAVMKKDYYAERRALRSMIGYISVMDAFVLLVLVITLSDQTILMLLA